VVVFVHMEGKGPTLGNSDTAGGGWAHGRNSMPAGEGRGGTVSFPTCPKCWARQTEKEEKGWGSARSLGEDEALHVRWIGGGPDGKK